MAPKGGTLLFLLIVFGAALAKPPDKKLWNNRHCKDDAKKLMRKCREMGHPVPEKAQVKIVFGNSAGERIDDEPSPDESSFLSVLDSATNKDWSDSDKAGFKKCDFTDLPSMIKRMKNSSDPSVCYMRAFVSPAAMNNLTHQGENMDSGDYDGMLWAAEIMLEDMPSSMNRLLTRLKDKKMKSTMEMLQLIYDRMSDKQRKEVVKWAKEQITQNYFNCTTSSSSRAMSVKRCKPSLKWLTFEVLEIIGQYLSSLESDDVDSSPNEQLCEFFLSPKFNIIFGQISRVNPSMCKKLLSKIRGCFSGPEAFAEHVDKLGVLACCYEDAPDMTSDLSRKLLIQLSKCKNPRLKKLKKHLVKSVMSASTGANAQVLHGLGSSVALLPPQQLSMIPDSDVKEIVKDPNIKWTKRQRNTLLKKILGDKKCKNVSYEELMELRSVMDGLPNCMFKMVKAQEILDDSEGLKTITKRMKKRQLVAIMQALYKEVGASDLMQKLPPPLLRRISLKNLEKANISLDQVTDVMWTRAQAAYWLLKMLKQNKVSFRNLRPLLQGLTCKIIDKLSDRDTQDLSQSIRETPQWLNKAEAGCAALKFFATLEKQRPNYFKTITPEELDEIPTPLLLHLPPMKVKDLPDAVCQVFLDKMQESNLTSLPIRSPSRSALTERALRCLTNAQKDTSGTEGADLYKLTSEDVNRLGPLLCEMKPSKLRYLAPDVLNSSLEAMASCQHIPPRHQAALIELVKETFGYPSDWSEETVEKMGPLIFLDDNAVSALPNKSWMKSVIYYLMPGLSHITDALKKKYFDLIIAESSGARKKRETNSNGNGSGSGNIGNDGGNNTVSAETPTVELIEQLGMQNVYWTHEQLEMMSEDTFSATVEILGDVPNYTPDKLAVLSGKAIQVFGPVAQMNESVVTQMGCIAQGFSDTELAVLPFSLDTLDDITNCDWSVSQMEPVWKGVANFNNLTAEQLDAAEMVALNRFICGLNPSEISQLNTSAFTDAVGSMDGIQCSFEVSQHLKSLAVSAFGDPSSWTEAEVSDLGGIIAGLNAAELASLKTSVFSFITGTAIPLIPAENFAALSTAQLEALGPDNAAMVTMEQRQALEPQQLAALDSALTGTRNSHEEQDGGQSGAPSLSVEGIAAFMKPLLFLMMGFMLL